MAKIDKDIPVPKANRYNTKYPFGELDVGDSFFWSETPVERTRNAAFNYGKAHGKKFMTRTCEESGVKGCRVWRIK